VDILIGEKMRVAESHAAVPVVMMISFSIKRAA
jgi:hypothetical protein